MTRRDAPAAKLGAVVLRGSESKPIGTTRASRQKILVRILFAHRTHVGRFANAEWCSRTQRPWPPKLEPVLGVATRDRDGRQRQRLGGDGQGVEDRFEHAQGSRQAGGRPFELGRQGLELD